MPILTKGNGPLTFDTWPASAPCSRGATASAPRPRRSSDRPLTSVALVLAYPAAQRFRRTAQLLRYRLHGRPLRAALLMLFLNQAYRPIPELFRVPRLFLFCVHGSILSKNRASEKSGVVHIRVRGHLDEPVRRRRMDIDVCDPDDRCERATDIAPTQGNSIQSAA